MYDAGGAEREKVLIIFDEAQRFAVYTIPVNPRPFLGYDQPAQDERSRRCRAQTCVED